ncbi:MAG: hypothetical protein NC403_09450 [Muribaculaceae bacterium]|nr:hypothetical protein [Muribaculaceae bacterium]
MSEIQYDDRELQRLFAELDERHRLRALKGAFRREANQVRKTAINNLRGSIRSDRDLERGIRAIVFKRKAGFRVTIGTKKAGKSGKEYGFHTNRRGLKKPVLIWAEAGTEKRYTKTKTKIFRRLRKGHYTGRMKRYGFMRQTLQQVRESVTEGLHNEIVNNITKVAKKYGCT